MANAAYIGVSSKARKVKNLYVGVNGVAKKVKKAYIGVNGVAKLFYSASRLPDAYQEVAYLQSSGTQYINTGLAGSAFTSSAKVESKVRFTSVGSDQTITGATDDQSYNSALVVKTNATQFHIASEDHDAYGGSPKANTDYTLVANFVKSGTCTLSVNGTQVASGSFSGGVTSKSIYAFAKNMNNTIEQYLKGRIYYLKITINGSLKRNFVPCYRKSDSVAGFYDLVGGAFYTNKGSGTFTVGADV